MKSVITTSKNIAVFRFIKSILKKMGYKRNELLDEDHEDTCLIFSMVSKKKEDYVSEKEVLDALK